MESPSASEGCRVVAQEDSSSVEKQPLSTCLAEADQAEKIVPNFGDETTVQERTSGQESPVKFHEPDFAFVEMTSRLSNDEEDGKDSIEDAEKPSASLETRDDPKDVATTSGVHPEDDSPLKKLADTKEPVDIENVMYDENFLSDEASATSSIESTTVKKRQTGDFLPINAEIKRIGLEISEEQAKQLKNDVRRLSPVLVSLRERTLGEISLTSDSGLFEENDQVPRLENIEVPVPQDSTESSNQPEQVSALPSTSDSTSVLEECGSGATSESRASSSLDNVPPASAISRVCEETKNNREVIESKTMNDERVSECLQVDEKSKCPDSPVASTVLNACSTPNDRSNVQRELMIVLSRVDDDDGSTLDGVKESGVPEEAGTTEERSLELLSQRVSVDPENLVTKVANKNEVIGDSVVLVGDVCLAPKYHDNDQLRRKSPKVVIERTLEDSPSPKVTTDERVECSAEVLLRENLDCVRRTLVDDLDGGEDEEDVSSSGDPLAINEDNLGETRSDPSIDAASDIQESFDTETETETCSDNSEIVSIASIHSGDCQERINDGTVCPESDSVVSDEIPGDPLTRLQPERPEAFTEDSAESLALATGARDEVRSDGSDSGLGSEIPGDPGPAPAPESDSETSFLDRIPDDILSDKDKVVNALETFVPDPGTSGLEQQPQQHQQLDIHPQQQIPLPRFLTPPKSSLKRRLTDCMEGEPSPKRINTDDPSRKKRNIQFDAVTVYYFPRAQGFTCVPSQGGSTLGMSATHTHAERFSLTEHAAEQRRLHRARLAQLRSERAATCVTEAASSSEDPSDDTDEEPSDTEELDIDSYYFLQPVPTWQRRALLRAAGVRRIDAVEKDDCRDIRASREHCGCGCKGYCDPESCPCSRANVKCQVDRAGFPCGCSRDGCANSSGRIEFNPVRVRTHFIHTLMRLQLEKKQRDEDRTDHELLMNNQMGRGPMREAPGLMGTTLGSMDHQNVIIGDTASCVTTGGFTTLHYESHDQSSTSCQPGIVHTAREDSLDLYAIRDDCYPPDEVDGGPNSQRKLHPEFGQAFQAFPGQQPAVSFPQTAYQDYQGYQALPSTSRSQFQPQFQPVPPANPTFSHYSYGQDSGVMQPSCQTHPTSHHPSVYETAFSQEDPSSSQQQYTNLNSVQPMNAVVQQMGKLEPFSELLAGRYSYYGDPEPQPITVAYHNNPSTKIEPEKTDIIDQQPVDANAEDCDENFGEIIKKSMVETVSA